MIRKHILGSALAIGLPASASTQSQTMVFFDNFSSYPAGVCWTDNSTLGPRFVAWSGFGCVVAFTDASGGTWLNEEPAASSGSGRSALTVGPSPGAVTSDTFEVSIKTLARLDKNRKPWPVDWAPWSYCNQSSFYNVVVKTNGWELDKEYATSTETQGQCFLAAGTDCKFRSGTDTTCRLLALLSVSRPKP
jgi:hypothetical protein